MRAKCPKGFSNVLFRACSNLLSHCIVPSFMKYQISCSFTVPCLIDIVIWKRLEWSNRAVNAVFIFFSLQKYTLALCSIKATNRFWDEGEKLRHLLFWTQFGLHPWGLHYQLVSCLMDGWILDVHSWLNCVSKPICLYWCCVRVCFLLPALQMEAGTHVGAVGGGRGWGDFKHRGRKHEPALPWHTTVGKETLPMPSGNFPGTFALLLQYHNSQTMWKLKGDIFSWSYFLVLLSWSIIPKEPFKKGFILVE